MRHFYVLPLEQWIDASMSKSLGGATSYALLSSAWLWRNKQIHEPDYEPLTQPALLSLEKDQVVTQAKQTVRPWPYQAVMVKGRKPTGLKMD